MAATLLTASSMRRDRVEEPARICRHIMNDQVMENNIFVMQL